MVLTFTGTWVDNAVDEDGYRIERSVDNGPFVPVAQLGPNVQTFQDAFDNVAPGQHVLRYHLAAFNAHGAIFADEEPQIVTPQVITLPAKPTMFEVHLV